MINKAYMGSNAVSKILLGSVQIYPYNTVLHYSTSYHDIMVISDRYKDMVLSNTYDTASDMGTIVFKEAITEMYRIGTDYSEVTYYEIPETVTSISGSALYNFKGKLTSYPKTCPTLFDRMSYFEHCSPSSLTYPADANYLGWWFKLSSSGMPYERRVEFMKCPQIIETSAEGKETSAKEWGANYLGYFELEEDKFMAFDRQLTKVPPKAFTRLVLSKVQLPETVKTIGSGAFLGSSISNVEMKGVETIETTAFMHTNWGEYNNVLQIPANIKKIETYAFAYMKGIDDVQFYGKAPYMDYESVFANLPTGSTFYIPNEYKSQYAEMIDYMEFKGYTCLAMPAPPAEAFPIRDGVYIEGKAGDTFNVKAYVGDGERAVDYAYLEFDGERLWTLDETENPVNIDITYTFKEDKKGYLTTDENCMFDVTSLSTDGCKALGAGLGVRTSDSYFVYDGGTNEWKWIA